MKGFAVLSRAYENETRERYPVTSRIPGIGKLIRPYTDKRFIFNGIDAGSIKIPGGFENRKIAMSSRAGIKHYGYSISRDYNINYNPLFHHSCMIRALDFYTIRLGCDMRLSEVVIADPTTMEGRNAFRLLLPIARRIILVTERKSDFSSEADYALVRYGTSVGVVEDVVKAAEHADVIVLASENLNHGYLADLERPTLYFRFIRPPSGHLWFDNVSVSFGDMEEFDSIFAQGFTEVTKSAGLWRGAEKEGFFIRSIKKQNVKIIER